MNFAIYKTKVGLIRIEHENDTVIFLKRINSIPDDWGVKNDFTDKIFQQILEYFNCNRKKFNFKYELRGTEFQKKVWKALCNIPYGETKSYKEIATEIGNPKACRAVGMANNKNPITIVVPCHRVIGTNGKMVGYAGGIEMKEILLNLEKNCYK